MLTPRHRPEIGDDPDDRMVGVCGTCGARVECLRYQTSPPLPANRDDMWCDMPYAECPECKALAAGVEERAKMQGLKYLPASGTRVYMRRKRNEE